MAKSTPRRTHVRGQRRGPPPQGTLLQVMKRLDGKSKRLFSYTFDMGTNEYAAIGFVMVQWAFMEETLYRRTAYFARKAKVKIPKEASDLAFARRLRALRLLVEATLKDPKKRKWWSGLISEIAGANGKRQQVTHGLWSFDARDPSRLYSRPRPVLGKLLTPFNVEKLGEFGQQLGEISFALLHPSQTDEWPAYMRTGAASVSRRFLLMMTGQGAELGFPPPTPVARDSPLTPSLASLLEKLKPKDR
jgi:hypothetical protein